MMGIDIKNIKKREVVIIAMAVVVILFIVLFWLFVYSPARRKMGSLRDEFNILQAENKKIEGMAESGKSLDTAYSECYRRLMEIDAKIPREERSTLSALSSLADNMNIEVSSIRPEKLKESSLGVKIEGKDIKAMPISMHISCDYKTLGEYLKAMRETLPTLLNADLVAINGPAREGDRLDISLNLTLYILSE